MVERKQIKNGVRKAHRVVKIKKKKAKGQTVDALARRGDEGRGKLR